MFTNHTWMVKYLFQKLTSPEMSSLISESHLIAEQNVLLMRDSLDLMFIFCYYFVLCVCVCVGYLLLLLLFACLFHQEPI